MMLLGVTTSSGEAPDIQDSLSLIAESNYGTSNILSISPSLPLASVANFLTSETVVPFTPAVLSPAFWYDATQGLYQERTGGGTTPASSDADPVGTWRDISGNSRHLVAAADSSRPTVKLAIQNGLPVIRSDGVDDALGLAFTLNKPVYLFIVARLNSVVGTNLRICDGNTNNTLSLREGDTVIDILGFGTGTGACSTAATLTNWQVYEAIFDGTSSELRISGGTATTGDAGSAAAGGFKLFARADNTSFSNMDAAEIVGCISIPSAENRSLMRAYALNKWAVP